MATVHLGPRSVTVKGVHLFTSDPAIAVVRYDRITGVSMSGDNYGISVIVHADGGAGFQCWLGDTGSLDRQVAHRELLASLCKRMEACE